MDSDNNTKSTSSTKREVTSFYLLIYFLLSLSSFPYVGTTAWDFFYKLASLFLLIILWQYPLLRNKMEAGSRLVFVLVATLILQFSTSISSSSAARSVPSNANTQYVRTSCSNTSYPRLCYRSLSIYASKIKTNPKLLAHTALNITLKATKSTSRLMKRMSRIHGLKRREAAALADCVELVGDAVYELQRSIAEMRHVRGSNFYQVLADVQTWVSAVLTDDDTCMEGFSGNPMNRSVKILARRHIVKISHLASNALALVNNYAASHTNLQ